MVFRDSSQVICERLLSSGGLLSSQYIAGQVVDALCTEHESMRRINVQKS